MKKLKVWAKENNMDYKEALNLHHSEGLPVKTKVSKTNRIYVLEEAKASINPAKVNDISISTPKFADMEESIASVRRNRAGTSDQTNDYYHIQKGVAPYASGRNGENDTIDVSEAIRLTQQCYFNFSDFRTVIDILTEFTCGEIYWRGGNKKSRDFFDALFKKVDLFSLQDKFYREYYRSGNDFVYRFESVLTDEGVNNLNKVYGTKAAKEVKLPVKYMVLNPASIVCGGNISFAQSQFYQKLNSYELQRLIKPVTDEDRDFLNSLPEKIKSQLTKKGATSSTEIQIPLDPEYCYFLFYKKQDYEGMAVPMGFPVLRDINFKAELKAIDLAVARTTERSILLITMGFENKNGELFIDSKAMDAMRALFTSESVKKTLVADFTTKGQWLIPEVDKILGPQKYEQVNQDIRTGLNHILAASDEKFANQSIKVKLFIQRLKQSRGVFINEFLLKEVKRISKVMGFKNFPTPIYQDLEWRDEDMWQRIVVSLVNVGYLSPEDAFISMETGILPSPEDSEESQRRFKKLKDEGLYQTPQSNPSGQLEVLSEQQKLQLKMQSQQLEHDDKQKTKDRKFNAENPAPAPIQLVAPKGMTKENGRPTGTNGPKKQSKPAKPSKAAISTSLLKQNAIYATDLNKQLESKLLKSFHLKKLNESQIQLKDSLLENIMMSEKSDNWLNEKIIDEYIKNPDKKNEENFNQCLATGEEHGLDDYTSALVYNSKIEDKDNKDNQEEKIEE